MTGHIARCTYRIKCEHVYSTSTRTCAFPHANTRARVFACTARPLGPLRTRVHECTAYRPLIKRTPALAYPRLRQRRSTPHLFFFRGCLLCARSALGESCRGLSGERIMSKSAKRRLPGRRAMVRQGRSARARPLCGRTSRRQIHLSQCTSSARLRLFRR